MSVSTRTTKRAMKQMRREEVQHRNHLQVNDFSPITKNQARVFDSYRTGKNIAMTGFAGCGKTYLAMGLALDDVLNGRGDQDKVVIVRSVVPVRDMGFLPGNIKEKTKVYEAPYVSICTELFGRGDAYDLLKGKQLIEFTSTSFVRGLTMSDAIVIVDEIQNCTDRECDSLITRIGGNCRVLICGDIRQSDLMQHNEKCKMRDFVRIISKMPEFDVVDFTLDDVVRSQFVRSYLAKKYELEKNGEISIFGSS